MEKNEAFRKQVLSHLYGLPEQPDSMTQDSKLEKNKETECDEKDKVEKKGTGSINVTNINTQSDLTHNPTIKTEKDNSCEKSEVKESELKENFGVKNEKIDDDVGDQSKKTEDGSSTSGKLSASSCNKSIPTHTTPTTTTSHLYSVLMAPLDGHSPYRDNILRFGNDNADGGPKKRMRLDNGGDKGRPDNVTDTGDVKSAADTNNTVGMDLTKNHKRKLKKKKRKHLLNKLEIQRAKDFIYSSENEQFSVEKLRTMIEDVTEFVDAIWDVYCSEARLKGESVEEEGTKLAAALKCLSASGEGSWGDLQLLSRAKAVLVLRSKNLAASAIARVENELGYESDIRSFIVRMLKFWMGEIVTNG